MVFTEISVMGIILKHMKQSYSQKSLIKVLEKLKSEDRDYIRGKKVTILVDIN